jgi:hypothetical protein
MSWKPLFEMFKSELILISKKKKALEDLFNSQKISKSTYNHISNDLANARTETLNRQKSFNERISSRSKILKNQIGTLEMFLANLEMHYSVGEIQDQIYKHQSNAISLGIASSKKELNTINEILRIDARVIESYRPNSSKEKVTPTKTNKSIKKEDKMKIKGL